MPTLPDSGESRTPDFAVDPETKADAAVVIVTYNNADHIDALLDDLRHEARHISLRIVIADNSSSDGTLDVARRHPDVIAVATGGNLGYSGGINVAVRHAGEAESILVLNPDLRVERGAVRALLHRLRSDDSIGAVVPLMRDSDGSIYHSLRREPTLARATADAFLGRIWKGRPLSEYIRNDKWYLRARPIDWATGAAVLIDREAAADVGPWDERFFLYSEETDFFRRLRAAGWTAWYEPSSVVVHHGGGSGSSDALVTLMAVNRIRYMDKHRPRASDVLRAITLTGTVLRRGAPARESVMSALSDRERWSSLLRGSHDPPAVEDFPSASIIVPAHNESSVIDHTLEPLAPLVRAGRLEVIVVCNGCTDDTADRARRHPSIRIIELAESSKAAALNAGDGAATRWPRIYLDADIVALPASLAPVIEALGDDRALAGRPAFRVDPAGASFLVSSYFRARNRIPSMSSALWGAGVYGLSQRGRQRFARFPAVTADDLFVDSLFSPEEKHIPDTVPVRVSPPLTSSALLGVLTRARRGAAQQTVDTGRSTVRELMAGVRGPVSFFDAFVFASFAALARGRSSVQGSADVWERDDTSRTAHRQGAAS